MSEIKDINAIPKGTIDVRNVKPDEYSKYTMYIENRDSLDKPKETQYSLYRFFQSGIEKIKETNSIVIGEKIISHSQIRLTNNLNKILQEFGGPEDSMEIDYDGINTLLNSLFENDESFIKIWDWLTKFANFYVNPNPENADNSNLILTQAMKDKIQIVTEAILNIIFRNLLQLIRVKHDYRLYGVGSTIFGGKSSKFASTSELSKYSSLPPSCWRQYTGNYIVGKSAYGEELSRISSTIKNSTYHIGPNTSYGVAPHTHTVVTAIGNIPQSGSSALKVEHKAATELTHFSEKPSYIKESWSDIKVWSKAIEDVGCKPDGKYTDGKGATPADVNGAARWSYSWNSKNGKLLPSSNMVDDIFNHYDTILPTYSSYVWKLINEDTETNITSPSTYIT